MYYTANSSLTVRARVLGQVLKIIGIFPFIVIGHINLEFLWHFQFSE